MIQTPINNPQTLSLAIRPIRIAYFVHETDEAMLAQIISLICTQWGGIYNLIIPVTSNTEIASVNRHYLEIYQPQWFVAYFSDDSPSEIAELQKHLSSLFPKRNIIVWGGKNFEKEHDKGTHTLDIPDSALLKSRELNDISIKGTENDLVGLALFGKVYQGQEKDYAEVTNIVTKSIEVGTTDYWERQLIIDPWFSVLNLTSYGLHPYEAIGSFESNHFDVFIVNSVSSICWYWNSRASREIVGFKKELGRRTILLPETLISSDKAIENMLYVIKGNISYPNIVANCDIRFSVWDEETWNRCEQNISEIDKLERLKDNQFRVNHSYKTANWHELFGEDEVEKQPNEKLIYSLGIPFGYSSYKNGYKERVRQITTLVEGNNLVIFTPPQGFNNRSGGQIALDIECDIWKRFPETSVLSKTDSSEKWFSNYTLSQLAQTNSYPYQSLKLNIPTEWDAISLFFENRGYKVQSTKTSQYSEALLNVMGGLRTVSAITTKTAYRLLELLEAQSTRKLAQKLRKELGVEQSVSQQEVTALLRNFQIDSDIFRGAKPLSDLVQKSKIKRGELLQILQKLCELNVIKRGFQLDCPRCGTSDWYSLENLSEQLVCTGCSNRFMLPVNKGDSEIGWYYRLSSLANRAMDQDILPAIYALYRLTKDIEASCMNLGLLVHKQGVTDPITDFDFLYVSNQKIYAGECKKGELGEKDLNTASLAAQLGFAKFYFCTVKTFSPNTMEKIEARKAQIKKDGFDMTIEVLSENELLTD